eukprot:1162025-Pelagomonas_calceolata.AAC.5
MAYGEKKEMIYGQRMTYGQKMTHGDEIWARDDLWAKDDIWASSIEHSHRHVTKPWLSARRVTARRRSPDQILVAGVEKRCPLSVGVIGRLFP